MTIDSNFYRNDIRMVLKNGPLKVAQIKSKLEAKNIKLDESQILTALDGMIKAKTVVRVDGKFGLKTFA